MGWRGRGGLRARDDGVFVYCDCARGGGCGLMGQVGGWDGDAVEAGVR